MKTSHILTILAAPFLFSNCNKSNQQVSEATVEAASIGDVSFARTTFESLARGESSVAEKIDWPVFTSLGENLGTAYNALPSAVEKDKLETSFITQFAVNFRQSGGTLENFSNWRVVQHDQLKTEVAADSPNGILTVIVAERDGVERVSSINIVK